MSLRANSGAGPSPQPGETRAHTRGDERKSGYRLEPHVCRLCFGRLASEISGDSGDRRYVCTNCGQDAVGHKPAVLCACGLKIRKSKGDGRTALVLVDAGVRCHENKRRSPEFPALYVASYGGAQAES